MNPKFGDVMYIGMAECRVPFTGHSELTSDIVFKIPLPGAYLFYYLREESQFRCADQ